MTKEERNKLYLESYRNAQREAGEAMKARDEAQERFNRAAEACAAWKTITEQAGIDIEAHRNGTSPSTGATPTPNPNPATPINKADFVRTVIANAGQSGITSGDIKAAAIKAGIKPYVGYPYTVINKLKDKGEITVNAANKWVVA